MDVVNKKVEDLVKEVSGMQGEMGAMKGYVEARIKEVEDGGKVQTAGMNLVVDQARVEFDLVNRGYRTL